MGGGKHMLLMAALKRHRQAFLSKFEVSLLYKVSSKTIKATKKNHASIKQ